MYICLYRAHDGLILTETVSDQGDSVMTQVRAESKELCRQVRMHSNVPTTFCTSISSSSSSSQSIWYVHIDCGILYMLNLNSASRQQYEGTKKVGYILSEVIKNFTTEYDLQHVLKQRRPYAYIKFESTIQSIIQKYASLTSGSLVAIDSTTYVPFNFGASGGTLHKPGGNALNTENQWRLIFDIFMALLIIVVCISSYRSPGWLNAPSDVFEQRLDQNKQSRFELYPQSEWDAGGIPLQADDVREEVVMMHSHNIVSDGLLVNALYICLDIINTFILYQVGIQLLKNRRLDLSQTLQYQVLSAHAIIVIVTMVMLAEDFTYMSMINASYPFALLVQRLLKSTFIVGFPSKDHIV
ncbi:hypothetical protein MP228_008185 [Amoeboaphelidium protococcarum]|nr:hypothetical protein MP228_008185 [Amoeboaphelidium protococcarum]